MLEHTSRLLEGWRKDRIRYTEIGMQILCPTGGLGYCIVIYVSLQYVATVVGCSLSLLVSAPSRRCVFDCEPGELCDWSCKVTRLHQLVIYCTFCHWTLSTLHTVYNYSLTLTLAQDVLISGIPQSLLLK